MKRRSRNPKKVHLSEKDLAKIFLLFQSGHTGEEIAEIFKVPFYVIYNFLKEYDIASRPTKFTGKLDVDDCEKLIRLYKEGFTLKEVGDKIGVNPSTVLDYLKRFGIEIRPRGIPSQLNENDIAKMIDLYQKGHTAQEVGAKCGVNPSTVLDYLKRFGIERRPSHPRRRKAEG